MRDPKTVEPDEVIYIIDRFCDDPAWDGINLVSFPRCTFGHIVLDDYNLGDGHIEFCLQDEQVERWVKFELDDCGIEYGIDPSTLDVVQQWDYEKVIRSRDKVKSFLEWLLEIPEVIRDDAE